MNHNPERLQLITILISLVATRGRGSPNQIQCRHVSTRSHNLAIASLFSALFDLRIKSRKRRLWESICNMRLNHRRRCRAIILVIGWPSAPNKWQSTSTLLTRSLHQTRATLRKHRRLNRKSSDILNPTVKQNTTKYYFVLHSHDGKSNVPAAPRVFTNAFLAFAFYGVTFSSTPAPGAIRLQRPVKLSTTSNLLP